MEDGTPAQPWTIRSDHVPGDLGFDPLGLKPKEEAAFVEMQNKELNNGRLAMLAVAGFVAQELADALGNHAVECQYFMEQQWDDYLRVKQAIV